MFIAAAVSQSGICTFRVPTNRVRLKPCNSLAKAKAPSDLTCRSLRSRRPKVLDTLSSASAINAWSKNRPMVRSLPEGVQCSRRVQLLQLPFSTR